jgi:threonine-phosphate decarboxylase
VIDEAYADFTMEDTSLVESIAEFDNLIIVKSLTKTYAIPGLRLGYLLSSATIADAISSSKMPWSVNTLAIEAGNFIIKHLIKMPLPLNKLLGDTAALIKQLNNNTSIHIIPTHTNFFLCETTKSTATELKNFLLNEYGILIRDASNFRGLNAKHFRIATQTKSKNELLIEAIHKWSERF